ncbi:MAG: type IV pili methyl-accepting chemotaxis transducer N-terminal domain-containing protein [Anaerolineaceae bacterium]|nr:type IV pili methyl-accepting chemotaxis transducer N-terminal domain-containing protein [Anaerolineaceae bacterium]
MTRFIKLSTIQTRLGIIFLAFLSLLIVSVVVTFNSLETQRQDARMINLAGRQRMLLHQITDLALMYARDQEEGHVSALQESINTFEQTLVVMQKGGQITGYTQKTFVFAPPKNLNLISELESLNREWLTYRENVDLLLSQENVSSMDSVIQNINSQTASIIEQADRVVQTIEEVSNEKITQLLLFQIIFLGLGLILLGAGWRITRESVVLPLSRLGKSAKRIGEGDLSASITVKGPEEARVLGQTIDTMRAQLLKSHQELQHWAATLEDRVQQRTRELEALAVVSREINSHLSIGEVLKSVTVKAQELSGSEVASLCLLDRRDKTLILHAASGSEIAIQEPQTPLEDSKIRNALHQSSAHSCGLQNCHELCHIIDSKYCASHLAAPLRSGNKVIGALCIGSSSPDAFQTGIESVLTQLAEVAAVAIENSRLYQQAEQAATLEERQRVSFEMHDGLLQTLSFLGIMVGWAKDQISQGDLEKVYSTLQQIERAEEQAEHEIRRAITSLQDNFSLDYTLQKQLAALADELSKFKPPIQFKTETVLPLVLPHQESEQVLRVVREALLNAQRYSQSEMVHLSLKVVQNEITIAIQDKGIGFDPTIKPDDSRAHFGIRIMQARTTRLGGELEIQSAPGAGTTVQLRLAQDKLCSHEVKVEQ